MSGSAEATAIAHPTPAQGLYVDCAGLDARHYNMLPEAQLLMERSKLSCIAVDSQLGFQGQICHRPGMLRRLSTSRMTSSILYPVALSLSTPRVDARR